MLNDLKTCTFKNGIGIKTKKLYKVRDQKVWKQVEDGPQGMKINFKAFAFPVLSATHTRMYARTHTHCQLAILLNKNLFHP